MGDLVEERTGRVPYFEALQILRQSDAILVIGSDAPAYSASKLYPCLLARRPLLAVLHADSPAVEILRGAGVERILTFRPERSADPGAVREAGEFLEGYLSPANDHAIQPAGLHDFLAAHGAREVARQQCEVFDRVVSATR